MAVHHGRNCRVWIGGEEVTADVRSIEFGISVDSASVTKLEMLTVPLISQDEHGVVTIQLGSPAEGKPVRRAMRLGGVR